PFYPPRARWYSGLYYPWFRLRRALHLESIHLPAGISFRQFVLGLLIPGYAFFANGRWVLGWVFLCLYGVAAVVFIVALGYQIASLSFGLMIASHTSSIVFLEGYWLRDSPFRSRLGMAFA